MIALRSLTWKVADWLSFAIRSRLHAGSNAARCTLLMFRALTRSEGNSAAIALDTLISAVPYDTLLAAFERVDANSDGELDAAEVDEALRALSVRLSPKHLAAFIRMGTTTGGSTLTYAEFLAMARRQRRSQRAAEDEERQSRLRRSNHFAKMPPCKAIDEAAHARMRRSNRAPSPLPHRTGDGAPIDAPPPPWNAGSRAPSPRPPWNAGTRAYSPRPPSARAFTTTPRPSSPRPPLRPTKAASRGSRALSPATRMLHRYKALGESWRSREVERASSNSTLPAAPDLECRLTKVIGMEPVKDKIRDLKDMLVKRRFRSEVGAPQVEAGPLHMIFMGAPGCGKTSIARLVARLLFELGAVRTEAFVEVQRSDLVATHIGQTGPKTRAKIEEAKGGILFVDEAYRLVSNSDKDFGTEALEEIMKDMTSGDPLVIAAGYPADMKRFLAANEGLKRRFNHVFDFPNFGTFELALMFELKVMAKGFILERHVTPEAVALLIQQHTSAVWRATINGGVAEALARGAMQTQDRRLQPTSSFSAMTRSEYKAEATMITLEDVAQAAQELMAC